MTCWYIHYKDDETKRIKSAIKRDVEGLKKELSDDLSDIAAKIFARLDVIEQAVADPDSEAAKSLRKKHGLGKQGPVTPIKGLAKKS